MAAEASVALGFLTRLAELKNQFVLHLANGSAPDYSDYKKICGIIEGVAMAEREFKDLLSRIDSDDDDPTFEDLGAVQ